MKKLMLVFVFLGGTLFASTIDWRLDRFNESGNMTTIDGKYKITKKDPLAGTIHVDYSDKDAIVSTRLKDQLRQMDKKTRDSYIAMIPAGGYLTIFIPRPVIEEDSTWLFLYEVYDNKGESIAKARTGAVLTPRDSATEENSEWIAVQTIPLMDKIVKEVVVEVTGQNCGETQFFTIAKK